MKKALLFVACFIVGVLILVFSTDDNKGKSHVQLVQEIDVATEDSNEVIPIAETDSSLIKETKVVPPSSPVQLPDPKPRIWRPQEPFPTFEEELFDIPIPIDPESVDRIFDFPEVETEFVGGPDALLMYIVEAIEYPEIDRELGNKGEVFVGFVVEKDGSLSNIKVLSGVTETINQEAKRIVRTMPNWIPAQHEGKIVRSRMRVPIVFTLM